MLRVITNSRTLQKSAGLQYRGACRLFSTPVYERKTPLEHIQLRPGMYVGSVEWSTADHWILDTSKNQMVKRSVSISPALLKLFDEIIVNAADNYSRTKSLSSINVDVKRRNGDIVVSVTNDGQAIPIQMHPTEKIYVPELIFGHLLTGSNFNDKDTRFTGGSHGYGAKLTNIFSKEFQVDIFDTTSALSYQQRWRDNMSICFPPVVKKISKVGKASEVKISFTPDLSKFGFKDLSTTEHAQHIDDIISLFQRRTIDIAGCLEKVNVSFNDKAVKINSFNDYARLYLQENKQVGEAVNTSFQTVTLQNEWQIGLAISPTNTFESISFVNNVWTPRGGTHVQSIISQVVKFVEKELKNRGVKKATTTSIKEHLILFLNSKVENPSFDGQTKDALITKLSTFTDSAVLSKEQLQSLLIDTRIIDEITRRFQLQEESRLHAVVKPTSKRTFIDIPKLEDAHFAGTNRALECTLILTEGDSAKALAVAGISATSREMFGVMPLRGKLLNVRVANKTAVSKNEELINLCKALGLDFKKSYDGNSLENEGLRYGKVMLMCDQDHDGSHIKGLIINFFDHFWPELLLKHEGFLQEFITPIVKVKGRASSFTAATDNGRTNVDNKGAKISKSGKSRQQASNMQDTSTPSAGMIEKSFYSIADYQQWRQSLSVDDIDRFRIKYYKGLGTSTAKEGQEYFREIAKHRKTFVLSENAGYKADEKKKSMTDRDVIDLVFSKHRVADRKDWLLNNYDKELSLDLNESSVSYRDFIDKELIHFSFSDNLRSIPSAIDGLKPSQRKVLYGCFKKNLVKDELKVVQLAGYIAEQTAYHHGEAALHATIINMAQDFVGANNVPLLEPIGQFGTRAKGGHDFASPRYIFTKLSPLARLLFPPEDDAILTQQEEDGVAVEPKYFLPIIPYVLVNGAQGIGTGWSTNIPPHHPLQIIDAVEAKLNQRVSAAASPTSTSTSTPTSVLTPWFAGFQGHISSSTQQTTTNHDTNESTVSVISAAGSISIDDDDDEMVVSEEKEEEGEGELSSSDADSASSESAASAAQGPHFVTQGCMRRLNRTILEITELPYLKWTEDYKKFLVDLIDKGKIKSFKEMHTTDHVRFEITAPAAWLDKLQASSNATKLANTFRLTSKIHLNNMHAFTAQGQMHRFQTAEEILDHHFEERWQGYKLRRAAMIQQQARQEAVARNKARFVDDILAGRLRLSGDDQQKTSGGRWQARALEDVERDLRQLNYDTYAATQKQHSSSSSSSSSLSSIADSSGTNSENGDVDSSVRPFDYLLSMSLQSLTLERAQSLRHQAQQAADRLEALQQQTEEQLWRIDLQRLRQGYEAYLQQRYPHQGITHRNVTGVAAEPLVTNVGEKRVSRAKSPVQRRKKASPSATAATTEADAEAEADGESAVVKSATKKTKTPSKSVAKAKPKAGKSVAPAGVAAEKKVRRKSV